MGPTEQKRWAIIDDSALTDDPPPGSGAGMAEGVSAKNVKKRNLFNGVDLHDFLDPQSIPQRCTPQKGKLQAG